MFYLYLHCLLFFITTLPENVSCFHSWLLKINGNFPLNLLLYFWSYQKFWIPIPKTRTCQRNSIPFFLNGVGEKGIELWKNISEILHKRHQFFFRLINLKNVPNLTLYFILIQLPEMHLHKTFWGTAKRYENSNLSYYFSLRPGSGREGLSSQFRIRHGLVCVFLLLILNKLITLIFNLILNKFY